MEDNEELRLANEKIKLLSDKVSLFEKLLKAEKQGVYASEHGFEASEMPYALESEQQLAVMWMNGWMNSETRKKSSQVISVIKWAIDNLEHIEELSLGYNQNEISAKVQFIKSKLLEFYSEQDN